MSLFKKINEDNLFSLPVRATTNSCGYDIFYPSDKEITILPLEQRLIKLGFAWRDDIINFVKERNNGDSQLFAKIFDKSGLALKYRFSTRAGVIDLDYKDEWGLICVNESVDHSITFGFGDKIGQFILMKYYSFEEVTVVRNGGFGSTD